MGILCKRLQHNIMVCNTLQRAATRCNVWVPNWQVCCSVESKDNCVPTEHQIDYALQHTAIFCNTLQHTATHCNVWVPDSWQNRLLIVHCNTTQRTATRCNMWVPNWPQNSLLMLIIHRKKIQHSATHWNTLQHTATHCNTLQYVGSQLTTK